ncbi:AbfB domain-containing protein [Micromonospora sp. DT4]|uniref:AbfB domain-containing protein n=1 Tax=Micromonospora sp. DT4 TaxID=3393438 RepID=UPI003CF0A3B4
MWDSTDLTSFTGYRPIRMHTLNTHTWAPTAFWDAARGQYAIVYSANNGQDVFLVNDTSDFRTVSSPQVFFGPGFGVLDGDVVVDGGTTYLYYKNLANGNLYGARSGTGAPNSFTTYTSGLLQGSGIEAPLLVKAVDGSGWRLWGDSYSPVNNDYYSSVFRADATFYRTAGLADASWTSFRSYNFPTRYLRHYNYLLRIDPLSASSSATDRQDATFQTKGPVGEWLGCGRRLTGCDAGRRVVTWLSDP